MFLNYSAFTFKQVTTRCNRFSFWKSFYDIEHYDFMWILYIFYIFMLKIVHQEQKHLWNFKIKNKGLFMEATCKYECISKTQWSVTSKSLFQRSNVYNCAKFNRLKIGLDIKMNHLKHYISWSNRNYLRNNIKGLHLLQNS